MRTRCRNWLVGLMAAVVASAGFAETVAGGKQDWEKYEIRVIRPRYFAKRNRLELGAELSAIMNQTFVYTYMGTGLATYHFSEYIGLELSGSYGLSIDKDEKSTLKNEFEIRTQILRTQYMAGGSLLWTPIYGKFQMPSGRVIYFDTFLSAGAGMTGVYYAYDWCTSPDEMPAAAQATAVAPPSPTTQSYPSFGIGLGQRFFIDKQTSIKWDFRDQMFFKNSQHAACNPAGVASSSALHSNVMLQFGASRFL